MRPGHLSYYFLIFWFHLKYFIITVVKMKIGLLTQKPLAHRQNIQVGKILNLTRYGVSLSPKMSTKEKNNKTRYFREILVS